MSIGTWASRSSAAAALVAALVLCEWLTPSQLVAMACVTMACVTVASVGATRTEVRRE